MMTLLMKISIYTHTPNNKGEAAVDVNIHQFFQGQKNYQRMNVSRRRDLLYNECFIHCVLICLNMLLIEK